MDNTNSEELEFRFTGEHPILDPESWTESDQNTLQNGPGLMEDLKIGYTFTIMFCLCKSKHLTPQGFLKKYFFVELGISIFSILISLGTAIFGLTFFSIQPRFEKDRELLSLSGGIFGLLFFGFKFYSTVISLRMLKKRDYSRMMGCAAGLSIIGHFFSLISAVILLFASLKQGIFDYLDAKGTKKELEYFIGVFLISLSIPLFLYLLLVIGQWCLGKEANVALDAYLVEYIEERKRVAKLERDKQKRLRRKRRAAGV